MKGKLDCIRRSNGRGPLRFRVSALPWLLVVVGLVIVGAGHGEEARDASDARVEPLSQAQFVDPKIPTDLRQQLADKAQDQRNPGHYASTRSLPEGFEVDNMTHGVLLHFPSYPDTDQLVELESLGVEVNTCSWIPEAPPDYPGFLYGRLPLGNVAGVVELGYLLRLSDGGAIGTQVPELKSALCDEERLNPYKHPNVDAILLRLNAVVRERSLEHATEWAGDRGLRVRDGRVNVEIVSLSGEQPLPADEVLGMGGLIDATWRGQHSAWLRIGALLRMADSLSPGYYIRRPLEPETDQVASEAPAAVGADAYHNEGWDGTGVTIGVIDMEFTGWTAAVANGDLPAGANTMAYGGLAFEGGGTHGTNCAEIAFDMAPGATYRAYRIANSTHLGSAVDDGLANEVNVFSQSISWYNTGWHDDTGAPCDAANAASSGGALFVASAGNRAEGHWQGNFADSNGNDLHEWSGTDEFNRIPPAGLEFVDGARFSIRLQWNADAATTDNYDLLLYNASDPTVVIDQSDNADENFEVITHTNTSGSNQAYLFRVERISGSGEFEIMASPAGIGYVTSENSTTSPSNATGENVVSVAAVTVGDFTQLDPAAASYSGRGPTNDGGSAPDIAGPTDCSTFTNSPGTFGGTSCATPNVAGAAAVRWSVNPLCECAASVRSYLYDRALDERDWGTAGLDHTYGHGGVLLEMPSDVWVTISRGLNWLASHQNADGSWLSTVGATAITALAFLNQGYTEDCCVPVQKAIEYILAHVHGDGSIHTGYPTYETALAVLPLFAARKPTYHVTINNARDWLVSSQWDESCIWGGVDPGNWYYGGYGYGSSGRPDLSNTQFALMALSVSDPPDIPDVPEDVWTKAVVFVERCQHDPEYNDRWWAHDNSLPSYDDGGFIYHPDASLSSNWRSYGSMTGAGIWSYRLSGVGTTHDKVIHALQWVESHEDGAFDDNPNMLPDSRRFQYYYYMSIAKALVMCDVSQLHGQDWYEALSDRLSALQSPDGSWVNSYTGHGSEHYPEIATAFSLLALETKVPPPADLWLSIILESPVFGTRGPLAVCADLHVYDPDDRHMGMNYETGEIECLIPGATLTEEPGGRQVAVFQDVQTGTYHVELYGLETCDYSVTFEAYRDTAMTSSETLDGDITPGETVGTSAVVSSIFGHLGINVDPLQPIPGGVIAFAGYESISLLWNQVQGALSYHVYYDSDGSGASYDGEDANEGPSPIDVVGATQLRLTGLTTGTQYYLAVTALDSLGESGYSHEVSCTPIPTISVAFDIKPGSCPNPFNTRLRGVLPTAILGTDDLDVHTIDVSSLLLEGAVPPLRSGVEDVGTPVAGGEPCECTTAGADGFDDLTLKFDRREIVAALGTVFDGEERELTISGTLTDGTPIEGIDCVLIRLKGTPEPPYRLAGQYDDAGVALTWCATGEEGVDHYVVYRNTEEDFAAALVTGRASGVLYEDTEVLGECGYWYWVTARNAKGLESEPSDPTSSGVMSGTEPITAMPDRFYLGSASPNPFNPTTDITYSIPQGGELARVVLTIYDSVGREVRTLVNGDREPGTYSASWDGTDQMGRPVASGVYFYRITWNGESKAKSMVLLK